MELEHSVKVPKATICFLTILMLAWWQWGEYSSAAKVQHHIIPLNIAPDKINSQNSGGINSTLSVPDNNAVKKSTELQQNIIPRAIHSTSKADDLVAA